MASMDEIVSLSKRRGFIFPGSELYGGLANSWDYGPLGVELKNNIKQEWWKRFVSRRPDVVGIDAALLMNPKVWSASGHLETFSDPLVECKNCHSRFRTDQLVNDPVVHKATQNEFRLKVIDIVNEKGRELDVVKGLHSAIESIFTELNTQELTEEERKKLLEAASAILDRSTKKLAELEEPVELIQWTIEQITASDQLVGFVTQIYLKRHIPCPNCDARKWGIPGQFNLMLKTFLGPAEDSTHTVYFRPETAQAMFVDFKLVQQTARLKIPFGIAQVGKAFRNEITPGNFIFRMREFEQMEIEYFVRENEWEKYFDHWLDEMKSWLKHLGVADEHLHYVDIPDGERAHYSKRTVDIEYDYPFGQKELYGLAYRTDFDLQNHMKASGQDMSYTNPQDPNDAFVPHVIEPTWGVDRSVLVAMLEAYRAEKDRVVMAFPGWLAPYKVAVFPLLANKEELVKTARGIFDNLSQTLTVAWDDRGNIGKRYFAQDEIGTPFCVTVDFQTLEDKTVTVRHRDSMKQDRVAVGDLASFISNNLQS